jgi:uncharacterized protein (DUF1810 family)
MKSKENGIPEDFSLERFITAQEPVKDRVSSELRNGEKKSHWMWFVFPQIEGLGSSPTAQTYAIRSLDEAQAYLSHDVLGRRLREWTKLVLEVEGKSAQQIFGYPDYLKFRSSMTLFDLAEREAQDRANSDGLFRKALEKYYSGRPDEQTLRILGRSG